MDGLLTAVQTKRAEDVLESATRSGISSANNAPSVKRIKDDSPEALLQLLQEEPTDQDLSHVLKCLDPARDNKDSAAFEIRLPNPVNGQILQILANKTIPEHWSNAQKSKSKIRGPLLRCFSSVVGLRALVGYFQMTNNALRSSTVKGQESGKILALRDVLTFTSTLLKPVDFVSRIYNDNCTLYDTSTKRRVAWSEFCSLLSGGKLLSTAAEALSVIGENGGFQKSSWIAHGHKFSEWLGKNLAHMIVRGDQNDEEFWKYASLIIGRAMGLGYTDQLVHELYTGAIMNNTVSPTWRLYFQHLRHHERSTILHSILRDIQKCYFASDETNHDNNNKSVGGVAALLSELLEGTDNPQETFRNWLLPGNSNLVHTFGLRRSLGLLVANDIESLKDFLAQAFRDFGDSFSIKHTILQSQEANAQVILLAAGFLQRLQPTELHTIGRSSLYLNAVSNRLAASSTRARFLGMVVGVAISNLVEPPGKGLKFEFEGLENEEAEWYLRLPRLDDRLGSIRDLHGPDIEAGKVGETLETARPKTVRLNRTPASTGQRERSKIVAIEEISDDDLSMEDEDFIPYAKPDSDASDSEDDPTLVQRGKPTAPVYIRDLIACLKDTENADRYHLGITSAASLIRRKAGFGTELLENIDGLALNILSLQDTYSLPNFHEHRLQAMIALLAAQPIRMGRLFTGTFFDGDLSQTQRSAILTAMGLGAREIAGYGEDDAKVMNLPTPPPESNFPTKKLPSHLQQFYGTKGEGSPISALTDRLSRTSLQPLALDAADAASGPNALKVRTFSSRMEVERQRQQRDAQRKKKTTSQDLHKTLTDGFFYPLVGRFAVMLQSRSLSSSGYNPFYSANILRLFLQTVTLIISTLGPHTTSLPAISQETLTLILALHGTAVATEPIVLPALLSLFLAVIDLNVAAGSSAEERLVTEHGVQVMELREWTNDVFERTPTGTTSTQATSTADDAEKTRMVAAGILVKLGEVIQRYQGRLMGINVGFKY